MLLILEQFPTDIKRGTKIEMISTRCRSYNGLIKIEYTGTEYETHKDAMNESAIMTATKVS